ncbi:hypothetical protein EDB95_4415 [Dinghuibacter silviterrae]|uniref:Uncharacterized protein n=1 Tax=Dinghuibacter silviterrae TaxID=1539049 RepID=A0A4V3GKR1_9BACT|nr:hypothetical protein EDB95_4415 [Dinghuibacter silviterrae]
MSQMGEVRIKWLIMNKMNTRYSVRRRWAGRAAAARNVW